MAIGEMVGMRWIVWGDGAVPENVLDGARPDRPARPGAADVSRVSLAATASYLPERWMTAAEVGDLSAIPER